MSDILKFGTAREDITFRTSEDTVFRRTVLPSGLRVLSEQVPGARSTSIGFWVAVGSRHEAEGEEGSTHFLEHLLFKSTKTRSPLDISSAFDAVDGLHNAITTPEYTCYYATVRDKDLAIAVEVLSDMMTSALLENQEFETERQVILEELAMSDDDPEDVAGRKFFQDVLGDHPAGKPVGGFPDIISAASREGVAAHYRRYYRPEELVITAAGAVNHEELLTLVQAHFAAGGWDLDAEGTPVLRLQQVREPVLNPVSTELIEKDAEQVNLFLGFEGFPQSFENRPALAVLISALGGSSSSRLFQEIREKRGLAYTVQAFHSGFSDTGVFGIYAGTSPKSAQQVINLVREELQRVQESGLNEQELALAKGQLTGNLALGSERSSWRMRRLGSAELILGEFADFDRVVSELNRVTTEQVTAIAREVFGRNESLVALGRVSGISG